MRGSGVDVGDAFTDLDVVSVYDVDLLGDEGDVLIIDDFFILAVFLIVEEVAFFCCLFAFAEDEVFHQVFPYFLQVFELS